MKGDFTRLTFRPTKHYNSVRMQQGRVQTDADWNEWGDIKAHLERTQGTDVIGICGVPRKDGGFEIGLAPDNQDLTISQGRIYVDGILCELEEGSPVEGTAIGTDIVEVPVLTVDGLAFQEDQWVELDDGVTLTPYKIAVVDTLNSTLTLADAAITGGATVTLRRIATYLAQPEYHPAPDPDVAATGTYIAYLDVWERHITALEDPEIREVALGGPDTATRKQTIRQLKLLEITDPNPPNGVNWTCWDEPADWTALITVEKGRLSARAEVPAGTTEPCIIAASAGYRGLENQLYRVEIHASGAAGTATFKWSRDNGIVVSRLVEVRDATEELLVLDAGKDQLLGFAPGQWVEVTDEARTLRGEPGILVQLSDVKDNLLVVDAATWSAELLQINLATGSVRRWDQQGATGEITVPTIADTWLDLEDGVQVHFAGAGNYNSGDYWQIPARVVGGDVEWPLDTSGVPLPQTPHGIEHHYCRLALVDWDSVTPSFAINYDCRPHFPALTEPDLYYISGDGQETKAEDVLLRPLKVGVVNCNRPIEGAWVKFEVKEGGGTIQPYATTLALDLTGIPIDLSLNLWYAAFIVPTDTNGVAQCRWTLPAGAPTEGIDPAPQQVDTTLLKEPLDALENRLGVPVSFGAGFGVAWQHHYDGSAFPDGQHPLLGVVTVEEALDHLRENTGLYHVSGDGQEVTREAQLPQALQVRVANGRWPRAGATVRFEVAAGNGSLFDGVSSGTQFDLPTDADGVAQCWWTPDGSFTALHSQQASATLIDPVDPTTGSPGIVRFNANLSIAEEVTYDGSAFPDDQHPALEVLTVEQALDQLRENTGLYHVSGDGQEATRGTQLPQALQVRVANGRWPRAGATVRFEVAAGNGSLFDGVSSGTQFDLPTDADGVAQCWWTPDGTAAALHSQQAMATLIDPVDPTTGLPGIVRFNANLSIAEEVSYDIHAESTPGVATVQAALDDLYTIKVNRAGDTITGSLVITGDLTVNGTTTTLNTATLEVEDNIIRVNTYPPQTVPLVINGGLEVFRGGTEPNAQIIWDETADQWQLGLEGSLGLSVDALGNISAGSLSVTGAASADSFSAANDINTVSKHMLIDHPSPVPPVGITQLAHAALDGAEYTVYYRGEATLDAAGQAVITLPAYFEDLTQLAGRTVQLTAQGTVPFALSASAVSTGQFTVYGEVGGLFSWEVKAVRKDIPALVVER